MGWEVGQPGNVKIRMVIGAFWHYIFEPQRNLKIRTINGAFCRYLIKHFDLQRNIWKQWINMVHSATIWYDISTWREKNESNESYWYIMSLFYTTCWRTGKNWKKWIQIVHSAAIWLDILTCRENVESKELNAFWDLWSTTFVDPRVLNFVWRNVGVYQFMVSHFCCFP